MSLLGPEEQVRLLAADEKELIRQEIQAAMSASHAELARVCTHYMKTRQLSYAALRYLMDGQLPEYLAAVSPGASKKPKAPRPRLTDAQAAGLLTAYRETYGDLVSKQTERRFFKTYAAASGIPVDILKKVVAEDKQRNPNEYRALKALAVQRRKDQRHEAEEAKRYAKALQDKPPGMSVADYVGQTTRCPVCGRDFGVDRIPRHGPEPHGCRGSGRFAVSLYSVHQARREAKSPKSNDLNGSSVRTVRGGLPGLGRRS
ncbi:C2HC-type zinc finger protein [Mycobacterium malmoense]|uniref:C2HC-type zinc finger protein n=1 Tax=Mycobacterium malmoense TaxID=1780 RepID=UPI0011478EAE|nr:C2HC-type zinc finger protein [Mycobacterium malmoense]